MCAEIHVCHSPINDMSRNTSATVAHIFQGLIASLFLLNLLSTVPTVPTVHVQRADGLTYIRVDQLCTCEIPLFLLLESVDHVLRESMHL